MGLQSSQALPSWEFPYGECQALPSPWLLASFPADVARQQLHGRHRTQQLLVHLHLLELQLFLHGLLGEHDSFRSVLQGLLSGPLHGDFLLVLGEEVLLQTPSEWPEPPSGESGCRDPNTPIYQAPAMCPALSGLL